MNYSHIAQLGRQAAIEKQAADPAPKEYPSSEFGKSPPVFKRRAGTPPLSWPDYSENPDVVPTVSDNPKYPIIKAHLPPGYTEPKSGIRSENYDAPFLHGYPRNDVHPDYRGSQRGLGPLVDSKQYKAPWPLYGHWLDPTPPEGSLKLDVEGDTQFQPKSYDFLKKERKERWEWEQKEEDARASNRSYAAGHGLLPTKSERDKSRREAIESLEELNRYMREFRNRPDFQPIPRSPESNEKWNNIPLPETPRREQWPLPKSDPRDENILSGYDKILEQQQLQRLGPLKRPD